MALMQISFDSRVITMLNMTGIEPAAIAGAAAKAAAKAAEEDPSEVELLRKIAEESGALEPAARTLAKRTAVKQQIRLKLWQPLGMLFGVSRDYFANDFENDMADRMADVPEEDVITPKLSVAGPAVQGISFSVEEPDLKAMYLNLLATASDRRSEANAHPSFSEVIRQLSAKEARLLASVLCRDRLPIIEIRKNAKTKEDPTAEGWYTITGNVLQYVNALGGQVWTDEGAVFVDNWVRLGLVNVDYQQFLMDESQYEWVTANPRYIQAQYEHDTVEMKVVTFAKGILTTTPFGRRFYEVAIADAKPGAPRGARDELGPAI
ncbi:hypothetical protein C6A85_000000112520 [Mycobacterium sp. ITM-2017-0098]|nr:hypothetical protein C6A85_000000112520 [Mycobacterium sp. ITM-2017-0098]